MSPGDVVIGMLQGVFAHAQDQRRMPVLILGGESVSLGMPRDAVVAEFAGRYRLLPFDGSSDLPRTTGSLIVMQKDSVIGVVTFRSGRLVNAERDWGTFYSSDGIDGVWTVLDGALSQQLPLNTWQSVRIRRSQFETPEMGGRAIDIRFADRTIEIQKGRSDGPYAAVGGGPHHETYSVSEILPSPLF